MNYQNGGRVVRRDLEFQVENPPTPFQVENAPTPFQRRVVTNEELQDILDETDDIVLLRRLENILRVGIFEPEVIEEITSLIQDIRVDINRRIMNGEGVFVREAGVLQPAARKLLEQVGSEEIKSLEIVRTPLSSFTKGFLNTISLGQFDKISKKYYDQMFHLSLWINGKYNLEKNEVVYFNTKNPKQSNSQVREVKNIPAGLTIQQLIDNAKKRMTNENFSDYDAEKLNCQNFLINVLDGSDAGNKEDGDFIFQDATKIFKELPEYAKVLGKASVKLGAIFNRLIYGEGQYGGAEPSFAGANMRNTTAQENSIIFNTPGGDEEGDQQLLTLYQTFLREVRLSPEVAAGMRQVVAEILQRQQQGYDASPVGAARRVQGAGRRFNYFFGGAEPSFAGANLRRSTPQENSIIFNTPEGTEEGDQQLLQVYRTHLREVRLSPEVAAGLRQAVADILQRQRQGYDASPVGAANERAQGAGERFTKDISRVKKYYGYGGGINANGLMDSREPTLKF